MIREVKRLYSLGLAIHWLKPKSKAPLEARWSSGDRKSFAELKSAHRVGLNVGVRLGRASQLKGGGYLAVIDCDVKGDSPRFRLEMEQKLDELYPGLRSTAPFVATGRGNGSAHYYVKTDEPITGGRLSQSAEHVKVKMPSAIKPSKRERETLSRAELDAGVRIRPAWELSLMSEGRQTVLPPSVHPDTGTVYAWGRPFESADDIPTIVAPESAAQHEEVKTRSVESGASEVFTPTSFDLVSSNLSDEVVDLIMDGTNCDDRSAGLFTAALHMVKARMTDQEILSVLTDPSYFLGTAGYDHAQTKSRAKAAKWVRRYTLEKARREADAAYQFDDVVEETPLSDDEAKAQVEEIAGMKDWRDRLERAKDLRVKTSLQNIDIILSHEFETVFKRNEFSGRDIYGLDTPWGGKKGAELRDEDAIKIKLWLSEKWRFEPNVNLVHEAMSVISNRNRFHPVREYLASIEWDGVERLDSWLKTYMGAVAPEPYLSDISRKTLLAMVTRVFEPGHKFDHVLVLEGGQGLGKSSAARILAGDSWYCDTLPDVRDKDAMLNLQGAWIVEIGELATLKRSDAETYKAFLTRQTDRVRAPYGRKWEEYPRQCVFIGTTNPGDYLKDKTGNRRFWPVVVSRCDFAGLSRDRDQLLAEALFVYRNFREALYLDGDAKEQAVVIQASKVSEDEESIMHHALERFVKAEKLKPKAERFDFRSFRLSNLFEGPGAPFAEWKPDNWHLQLAAGALRRGGFEKFGSNGTTKWRKIIESKAA